jgi:putative transposase
VLQAYRFALDPTAGQARALASHCGAARKAFNEGLARVRRCLDQRAAERSYGVPEDQLTEVPWTLSALRRWWNANKDEIAACGAVKAKLALAERNWTCDGCGARHDRDANAAINLARLSEHAPGVEGRPAGSGPVAGRRVIRKTSPPSGAMAGGEEASTPHSGLPAADQTGTAPPQGEAA